MGYRTFRDSTGVEWDAWDVVPQLAERRVEDRRQARQPIQFDDRRRSERRIFSRRHAVTASGLSGGWLCFEGPHEKRRLNPIPDDWTRCPDAQLEAYCQMARPVRRPIEITDNGHGPA
jgi:hypothetical protein